MRPGLSGDNGCAPTIRGVGSASPHGNGVDTSLSLGAPGGHTFIFVKSSGAGRLA